MMVSPLGARSSVQWTAPNRSQPRRGRDCGVRVVAARPPKDSSDGSEQKPRKMQFEVKVVTPPERSLGPHMLPKNTHCGDTIELKNNKYYVVDRVCTHYKLEYGKYKRDDTRLYVQEASRYILNRALDSLLESTE
mmetsp:Transcript_5690/g.25688  ORF Transcript_5690/g.25688 Transcript_5690/m.25688 type:complete len:135 (-) Transcript_5690:978-1382(-)